KKTTFRWFHDTAYCFDYSAFPMVAGVGLEPTQRERRGILNWLLKLIKSMGCRFFPNIEQNYNTLNT
ncbi:hypothetical protein ACMSJV_004845, partial [Enterobacter hormaechei]